MITEPRSEPRHASATTVAAVGFGLFLLTHATHSLAADSTGPAAILGRVTAHDFHPIRDGFTYDRTLNQHGVASLADQDWRVRTLAVRDLVRLGALATPALITALGDKNEHVRHVAAMVLGIMRATNACWPDAWA